MSRAISNTGELGMPKSGHGRTVDMATSVEDVLQRQETALNVRWLGQAEKPTDEMPAWCFPTDAWTPSGSLERREGVPQDPARCAPQGCR